MAVLKPYLEYRDSGVPWLGEVPKHWKVQKLRTIMKGVTERNRPDLPLLSVVREKGVILRDITEKGENHNFIPDDLSNYKVVREGQFVMNKMKAWQGSYGVSRYNGIVSPAYFVFDIHLVEGSYFHSAIRSKAYVPLFTQASDGVRIGQWDLSQVRMKEIPFFIPSLAEQSAIVRFLDHMDRRIRRNILAKQKLIKLLEEYKQVIIHRAVTRGLDPTVPLKPSGVDWLGEVPKHWKVWQIGHFSRVGNGSTPSRGNSAYWNRGHYPWLNSAYANQEVITKADQFVTDIALEECHLPIVPPSSVLVAITGQGKTRGKAALLCIEATINQHMAFIIPRANIALANYLRLVLHGAYNQLRAISDDSGSTKGALTCTDLKHFSIALPPLSEQRVILKSVRSEIRTISINIDHADREISLLREYRTRLISDVVTGKIDVRGIDLPAAYEDTGAPAEDNKLFDTEAAPEDCEIPEEIPAEAD